MAVFAALAAVSWGIARAGPGHSGPHGDSGHEMLENMRKMHSEHEHKHDFEAINAMSPEQSARMMDLMRDVGLALPPMDSHRGHLLFINKGCVLCHKVNGIGGDVGPPINADDMPSPMNVFEFAARMWKGSPAMVALQEEELGEVISLTGQDLADLIAFAHDEEMQATVSLSQVPEKWRERISQ
jgi:mono/diheme cytochrome c family protein